MGEVVEGVVKKLLALKDKAPYVPSGMTQDEVVYICNTVKQIFLNQPVLLELKPPLLICGDTHGQFHDLLRIFDIGEYPPYTNYLFLGDYVDRGYQSIETVTLLFCYKILYPNNFFMLRGNHECSYINRIYGFYEDCCRLYSNSIWQLYCEVFNCLPIAAIVDDKIFCIHGGISPHLESLDQIRAIQRPVEIPDEGLLCDLLWADPEPAIDEWGENDRGVSVCFGAEKVEEFLQKFGFDLICRAHQAVMDGYDFPFHPPSQSLVTIFSAPNYCYEFKNKGAVLRVDEKLFCTFSVLDPEDRSYMDDDQIPIERAGTPPREGSTEDTPDYIDMSPYP